MTITRRTPPTIDFGGGEGPDRAEVPPGMADNVIPLQGEPVPAYELPEFVVSEDALAGVFENIDGKNFRHVSEWARWFEWTGTHWRRETTLLAFDRVRVIVRGAARAKNRPPLASAKVVAGVEKLARGLRSIAATTDQWDIDAWLLNTPAGTIELGEGSHRLRPHRREDFCSKITAVGPSSEGCPLFLDFLKLVTDGDNDLIAFLQRLCGYCLTGSTREQVMAFFFGTGQNGKSTFLDVLRGILGIYATEAAADVF